MPVKPLGLVKEKYNSIVDGEGNVIFDSRKIPSSHSTKLPIATWTGAQGPHSIENLSKTYAIRFIRVEIKK
jgi:hypothetical protein